MTFGKKTKQTNKINTAWSRMKHFEDWSLVLIPVDRSGQVDTCFSRLIPIDPSRLRFDATSSGKPSLTHYIESGASALCAHDILSFPYHFL